MIPVGRLRYPNARMSPALRFARFVALGDSMSIDLYPELDHLARDGGRRPAAALGAASLLYRNRDDLYPDFARRDLVTAFPGIESLNLCVDGATVGSTRSGQLPRMPTDDAQTLVTITAGGNDLLELVGAPSRRGEAAVAAALHLLRGVVAEVRHRAPHSVVLLATVYDPTDGTGQLDRIQVTSGEYGWLATYNAGVGALCDGDGVRLVDVYGHFFGHGVSAPAAERWYWPQSIIEPGTRAASEIRRRWLEVLDL